MKQAGYTISGPGIDVVKPSSGLAVVVAQDRALRSELAELTVYVRDPDGHVTHRIEKQDRVVLTFCMNGATRQ